MNMTTYLLCAPALLVVLATVVALLNDLTRQQWAPRWHVRRLSLAFAGAGAGMLLVAPFAAWAPYWQTLAFLALFWGIAGALLTHPGMPPWTEFFGFVHRKTKTATKAATRGTESLGPGARSRWS